MTRRRRYTGRRIRTVVSAAQRELERRELLAELRAHKPRAVFSGCLAYAIGSGSKKAPGYAANLFREMFGSWPRSNERGPPVPLPGSLVDRWVERRRSKAFHIRFRIDRPAPLLAPLEPGRLQTDADGFTFYTDPITGKIERTLMRPEDWEVKW